MRRRLRRLLPVCWLWVWVLLLCCRKRILIRDLKGVGGEKRGWTERFVNTKKMKLKDGERCNRIANRERERGLMYT